VFINVAVADSKDRATGILFRSFAGVGAIPHLPGVGYAGNRGQNPRLDNTTTRLVLTR
jgi:hypothetical protein